MVYAHHVVLLGEWNLNGYDGENKMAATWKTDDDTSGEGKGTVVPVLY